MPTQYSLTDEELVNSARLLYEYAKAAGGDDVRAFVIAKRCFLRVVGVAREEFAVLCDGMDRVMVCDELDSVMKEAFALPPNN